MRNNQVSILIERFGDSVPKDYPDDVQRISVYCDDFKSVYKALSKAYAMAINELNEHEVIGVRANVSTNEFSYIDGSEMHGMLPRLKRDHEEDVNYEYWNTRLEMFQDLVWAYEHVDEIMEVLKDCHGEMEFETALKKRFGLNDLQIRKLSQIRIDMLTRAQYEKNLVEIRRIAENVGSSCDGK